jgi:hypothetical protein
MPSDSLNNSGKILDDYSMPMWQLFNVDQYSLLVLDFGLQAEKSARNKRSEVAFLGADWEGDADPFPIIGFIPQGCFLIA